MARSRNFEVKNCISKLRRSRLITQVELAHSLGISKNALSSIELGKSLPSLDIVASICFLFGVPISDFLWFERDGVRYSFWFNPEIFPR